MSDSVTNGKPADLVKERRRQIFEATARVFAAKGFHKATVNEIAHEAGLGKGTIYEYVRSKKELLFLIIEEGHALLFEKIDAIEKMDIPPEEKLRGVIHIQLHILNEYRDAARALIPAVEALGFCDEDKVRMDEIFFKYSDRFRKIFEEGIQTGVFREMDRFLIMEILWICCAHWGMSGVLRKTCGDSIETFEESLTDIIFSGIIKR
jgi:3-oxoacyl-[acyl-carrier protein] reductase